MNQEERTIGDDGTREIIGAFYYVYNALGAGFLESVYSLAMRRVLERNGHRVRTEVRVPIYFEGSILAQPRLDMLVDERIIVEIKSTESVRRSADGRDDLRAPPSSP